MPWLARVREARTRDDVVRTARDFVAQLTRTDLDRLPVECRPGAIASEADLQEYALQLARHHAHGDAARMIMKISAFFSSAAARLAELAKSVPPTEGNE
jgi:3-deoxy-D-arabino-heptulosonate 7-phosphate (DAHP) synthase